METPEEFLDLAAKQRGYKDFNFAFHNAGGTSLQQIITKAMVHYSKSQCDKQRELCAFNLGLSSAVMVYPSDYDKIRQAIIAAPTPDLLQ